MRQRGRRGFTLVELLVVISIIIILMSILLPALKKVRIRVGVGVCAKQIASLNTAFHSYINEWGENLLFMSGTANLPVFQLVDIYIDRPSGMGVLYDTEFITEHEICWCPSAVTTYGEAMKESYLENFASKFANYDEIVSDYAIGYRTDENAHTGYSPYPRYMTGSNRKLEDLKRTYIAWIADCKQGGWWRPYNSTKHDNYTACNVGLLDAGVDAINNYADHEPTTAELIANNIPPGDYYWPANDGPSWLWWRWFGPGNGY